MWARISAIVAICIAGYLGVNPPGFVAQVVAFAFGLAAAAFFPTIILGIFDKRMNKEGAIAGILTGLIFTFGYIIYFVILRWKSRKTISLELLQRELVQLVQYYT